jgi:hypothetical protein
MAQALNRRMRVLLAALLIALTGCASVGPPTLEQQRRTQVSRQLDALGQGLRGGTWSRVEQFFSPSFREGYGELRDRMEESFRSQRIVDLQFTVNRVLESDGLVNAQVRWNKSWVDKTGKPGKASGVSEFVLQPTGDGYRIVRINGDRLF